MKLIAMVFVPAIAASIGVMALLVGPWMAWKWMGVHDLICFGLFSLELIATVVGIGAMYEWKARAK